jgi:outer membrane immunogenic protein
MKTPGIIAATALAATSPAYAQITGGGPHVEAHLGWDSLAVPDQTGQTTAQSPSSRLLYGAGAGYDVNLGHSLVLGVDTNFDLGGATNCTGPVLGTADSLCGKMVRDWDVGARLGLKTGLGLFYGRVAYDNSLVRSSYLPGDGTARVASDDYGGLRLGVGTEVPLTRGAYLKAEYRYTTTPDLPDQNQLLAGIGIHF